MAACITSPDPHAIDAAVHDALLVYLRTPTRYDPARGSLITWLARIALNRVRDHRRARLRWTTHEVSIGLDLREVSAPAVLPMAAAEEAAVADDRRREFLAVAKNERERRFADARLRCPPTAVQAHVLGVSNLPPAALNKELARVWDLLCRRFRWRRRGDTRRAVDGTAAEGRRPRRADTPMHRQTGRDGDRPSNPPWCRHDAE